MTLRPESRSRTRTRSGIRTTRRRSPCYRHPDEPITGICASCLRERLSGLDAAAAAIPNAASPELRRCRSVVSISKCEASSSSLHELRRKSCDVVSARSSLSNLFDVDDLRSGSETEAKVESKNVGLSSVTYTVIESKKINQDRIRVSGTQLGESNVDCVDSDGEVEQGEFKTMKEYIDLECQDKAKKSKDLKEIAGSFLGAASVFSRKLRKWRQKDNSKTKKLNNSSNDKNLVTESGNLNSFQERSKLGENHSEIMGRRSCDTEPRFSVDAGRISFEEPRASWDGYMIARTIPRLAPMFSVVENGIFGNINNKIENHRLSVDGPMHSIIEDESSSGASGSGVSNSDSSSSMRRSSFDRSSSVRSFNKKSINSSEENGAVASPANVKLVITEKELKDWQLSSNRDRNLEKIGSLSGNTANMNSIIGNSNVQAKKTVKWRKVCNVFGFKIKDNEHLCNETSSRNIIDPFLDNKKQFNESGFKLSRSSSVVGSRNSCDVLESKNYRRRSVDNASGFVFKGMDDFKLERNRSTKYSTPARDLDDNGVIPFYMTPLRSLRSSKSGKFNLQNSHSIAGNILQLN